MSHIADFIKAVQKEYATGKATEHSYRPALKNLFEQLAPSIEALNEPKRIECGAPDFEIKKGEIAVGYVEAKDIGVDLQTLKGANKAQQARYTAALSNLIYTNCLDWEFYQNGKRVARVSIAYYLMGIQPRPDSYAQLEHLLGDFIAQNPQTITSPEELATRMAGKANLIKDVLSQTLSKDAAQRTKLTDQYKAFQENLIHDISTQDFADTYAETIAYGMFAARLHDTSLNSFSRQEALELLPKSNPFLRHLFGFIAGHDLDSRIAWIIDDLARIFQACDLAKIMAGFGKLTGQNDPFLHFYETFLAAYDPAKRRARGVWYTPEAVVNFITRAVDDVLKAEFGLPDGLADTSKVTIESDTGEKEEVHRVQILDPATGTGTFLAYVIKQIAPKVKNIAPAMWSAYIEAELIPRLHGFELLMASYAMCHTKLDMVLGELGYQPTVNPPRLSVYLTNALEEGDAKTAILPFARWLSDEAEGANKIKRDKPIMCVMGNPPYSGISQNKGAWITGLIEDYKYVDGVHFRERKHWLQDDYVKFIRLSEHLIAKNGEGVLGFITNHGYLDNPTFRGMRWHLLKTFDKIWVLDLHGNAKKKEQAPNGSADKNVFDIQQGVSIIIAVKKKGENNAPAQVMHGDLWGNRAGKYDALNAAGLRDDLFTKIDTPAPQHLFIPRDDKPLKTYEKGFSLAEFMPENVTGIVTAKDKLVIDYDRAQLTEKINRFVDTSKDDLQVRAEFFPNKKAGKYPSGDSRGWKLPEARVALKKTEWEDDIKKIVYRPFDTRAIIYREDMVDWGRFTFMRHMLAGENVGLVFKRGNSETNSASVHVTDTIIESRSWSRSGMQGIDTLAPLYLYPDAQELDQSRRVNFDDRLYKRLQKLATDPKRGTPDELQTFDYIYGVLHCPAYRTTYAEFLKSDFPRIPWPANPAEFWDVAQKGHLLRRLHLMDADTIGDTPYPYDGQGDNVVDKPAFKDGRIFINKTQYFDAAPPAAWDFYIGGYQPAQKWLKDRKGRALSFDDIQHYQRILKILSRTDKVMQSITMTLAL